MRPFTTRFNSGASRAGRGSDSGHTFVPRKRCFDCGSTRHFRQNCPQLLGKTPFKPEANVSRVGVGVLRNEPALKEQSLVTSVCEQGRSDFVIASLFDCVMPSVNGCDLDKPNVDSVILQNNTVCLLMLRHLCRLSLLNCHL